MSLHKMAIVGSKEVCSAFRMLGAAAFPVQSAPQALQTIFNLKKETIRDEQGKEHNTYAVIFVTENFLQDIAPDDEKRLAKGMLPAIIPLPTHKGTTGYGLQRIKRIVERAIGSDILQ